MGAKTPLPRWRIMTTCWTSAHRPQTIWNQKADDWDSWEITLLPLHQRIRRKSTSCNLTPNVFKTLPLKAIWEFGPCEHKLPVLLDWCPPTSAHTISPLHTNLQVANFQRCECVFTCPIMWVSSRDWCTFSCMHPLQVVVLLCTLLSVHSCTAKYTVLQYLHFNARMWGKLQLALCLLLLTIFQFYHLPPPLPPLVSNSYCVFIRGQPLYASYFSALLYCKSKLFSLFFVSIFMYHFC